MSTSRLVATLFCSVLCSPVLVHAQDRGRYSAQGVLYQAPLGGGAVALDRTGAAYIVESAGSQVNGQWGVWVSKVDPDGRTLVYRVFVPGDGDYGLTVDASGNVFVVGTTATPETFPATARFGPAARGIVAVAAVTKLDSVGHVEYSVLVGGARSGEGTYGRAVGVDAAGNAFVTGVTTASDYPVSASPINAIPNGALDVFVFKLDPSGRSMLYSTRLGGLADDDVHAIAVDDQGTVWMGGTTWSADFPTTPGAVQTRWAGGGDGFLTHVSANGASLEYSTLVGGAAADGVQQLRLGGGGSVYASGFTYSANFPVTPDAAQTQYGGSGDQGADLFVLQLGADSSLQFSTYLGGPNWEWPGGLGLDAAGHVVVAGRTTSAVFPITDGAVRAVPSGTFGGDGFLTTLDGQGEVIYSTYLGLGENTPPIAMATGPDGDAYVTGGTSDSGFLLKLATRAALKLQATATSEESVHLNARAAVDGDPWTRWSSDFSSPQWLIADIGHRATIDRVVISWESAYSTAYLVQVAEDGADIADNSSWRTVYGTTTGNGGVDDLRGLDITGRYLRLVGQERATPWGHSVWEFAAFGSVTDGVNQRPTVAIAAPADRTRYAQPRTVDVVATAFDTDTGVSRVVFFVNGSAYTSDATAPYTTTINLAPGIYTLGAVAYDAANVASEPAIVTVIVDSAGVANLAAGRPASASSEQNGSFPASSAVDANGSTRWSSAAADGQWLAVDLGVATHVDAVRLAWEAAYATAYDLQVSDDGITWTTIYASSSGAGGVEYIGGLSATGRYLRVLGRQRATPWGISLWEFEVFGTPIVEGSSNVALAKTVAVSSVESQAFPGPAATDGNAASRWSSAFSDPQWLAVDLGGLFDISRIVIQWERAFASAYRIDVSNDNQNWRMVRFVESSDGGTDDLTVAPVTARYVRLYSYVRATEWGVSIWELEVYGTPARLSSNLAVEAIAVIASSVERPDTAPTAAVDGNLSSRWSSAFSDYQWLVVDLGEAVRARRVLVRWEAAYASRYEIQASDDGVQWSTAAAAGAADGGDDDLTIDATGRFFRVLCLERGTPWGCSIYELEIFSAGPPGT